MMRFGGELDQIVSDIPAVCPWVGPANSACVYGRKEPRSAAHAAESAARVELLCLVNVIEHPDRVIDERDLGSSPPSR